jgi:hypothetical protein
MFGIFGHLESRGLRLLGFSDRRNLQFFSSITTSRGQLKVFRGDLERSLSSRSRPFSIIRDFLQWGEMGKRRRIDLSLLIRAEGIGIVPGFIVDVLRVSRGIIENARGLLLTCSAHILRESLLLGQARLPLGHVSRDFFRWGFRNVQGDLEERFLEVLQLFACGPFALGLGRFCLDFKKGC